jgi:molecular chaperone HscB
VEKDDLCVTAVKSQFFVPYGKSSMTSKVSDPAIPILCWSCSVGHSKSTLFCPHCNKIQPPPGGNYFSVFGLEPKLNLDLSKLETEFHRLSRKLHPDRFACSTENEKKWSLADTALLNDAYRTLKDPLHRTEYLLKLKGAGPASGSETQAQKAARAPADLLEKVFDLNMQLEEMRMARKAGENQPELQADLTGSKKELEDLLCAVDQDLHAEWTAWDEGDPAAQQAAQKKMLALLDRWRFIHNLLREVTETLGN